MSQQWNRSVNVVLTAIPAGVLGQYVFTLTLPCVSDHPYGVVFKPSPDMPPQLYSALLLSGVCQLPLLPPLARRLVCVRWSLSATARVTLGVSSILSSTLSVSTSSFLALLAARFTSDCQSWLCYDRSYSWWTNPRLDKCKLASPYRRDHHHRRLLSCSLFHRL